MGAIGSAVALRAKVLGMHVVVYDPYVSDGMAKAVGAKRMDSPGELAAVSDCVTLHCLLNDDTHKLVDARFISAMKPASFLVNTARGAVVDEEALADALRSGHLCGAALDVVEHEPFDKEKSLFKDCPNFIVTPHIAWFSQESVVEMRQTAAGYVKSFIEGKPPRNVVNKHFF